MRKLLAAGAALLFVLSAVAAPAAAADGSPAAADGDGGVAPSPQPLSFQQSGTDDGPVAECAASSPENHTDPDEDVIGWADGHWYDEPIAVDQSDGLNETEIDALVARTQARVEAIRCLQFEQDPPVDVISRAEFSNQTRGANVSEAERQFENVVYEALMLVDDEDAVDVQRENLDAGVGGYYEPATGQIVLVADNRSSLQVRETVLAHELVHALQDQHFDLSQYDARTIDGAGAERGVVEGDAGYVETIYERACVDGAWEGTCRLPETDSPTPDDLANVGVYLIAFHPYSDGPAFVHHLRESADGWEAVDEAYERPPATSQQVLYPELYPDETARNLTVEDRSDDDWERLTVEGRPDYEVAGEPALFTMFAYPTFDEPRSAPFVERADLIEGGSESLSPYDYSVEYTDGWDGDRLYAYRSADNETGYVWTLAWESEQEAAAFASGYGDLLRFWGADPVEGHADTYVVDGDFDGAYSVQVNGSVVRIVHAPTVENLTELDPGAAPTGESNVTASTEDDVVPGFGVATVAGALGLVLATIVAAALARRRAN